VVDTSLSGMRVASELDRLVAGRGRPRMIVSDNVLSAKEREPAVKVSLCVSMLLLRDVGQVVEPGGFHRQGKRSRP